MSNTVVSAAEFAGMTFTDECVELSEGRLVRQAPAGWVAGRAVARIGAEIASFVATRGIGAAAISAGFRLSDYTVRVSDVSFVSKERLASVGRPEGFWPGAPDLAVEVVSPSDSASELRTKVEQFFRAGTRLVWLVFPTQRQVHVYGGPKQITILDAHETLTGVTSCRVFPSKSKSFSGRPYRGSSCVRTGERLPSRSSAHAEEVVVGASGLPFHVEKTRSGACRCGL